MKRVNASTNDGCDLASTLCKYNLRKGDLFVRSWARVRQSEARKSLFRAANVWWRYVQYFVIASCDKISRDNSMYMAHDRFYNNNNNIYLKSNIQCI